jgi:CHASE3 domain sensor protein
VITQAEVGSATHLIPSQRRKFRRNLNVFAFCLAMALPVFISAAVCRNTEGLIGNARNAAHTLEVLSRLTNGMDDIKARSLGTALTGDTRYLDPVVRSMGTLLLNTEKLRTLTADSLSPVCIGGGHG